MLKGRFETYPRYWVFGALIPFVTVVLDQLTKLWAIRFFKVPHNICEINLHPGLVHDVSPIIDLALVCNPGISYGLLQGDSPIKRWGLTVFALIMCIVLLYMLSTVKDRLSRISIGLIIGGAIGNAIDRALYGAVTDFISANDIGFPWVFNIADSAITCGVIGLLIASFLTQPDTQT